MDWTTASHENNAVDSNETNRYLNETQVIKNVSSEGLSEAILREHEYIDVFGGLAEINDLFLHYLL